MDLEQELGQVGHHHQRKTAEKDIITDSIDVKDRGTGTCKCSARMMVSMREHEAVIF